MSGRLGVAIVVLAVALGPSCRRSRPAPPEAVPATSAVAAQPGTAVAPTAAQLEAYVTGAGKVELGMTEDEVSAALGKKPTRREGPSSPGASADVTWEGLEGVHPGSAIGNFREGRLFRIELVPSHPVLPRVEKSSAEPATRIDFVRRSVARTLTMADVEAVTGVPGYRATWSIASGFGMKTTVYSRWLWEIEPGREVLYVDEEDSAAGQPVIREKR